MKQKKRSRSERVYDVLLRLVPDREGAVRREMREVFRDALRDDTRGAPWRLWAGALIDLGRTVLALRRARPGAWLESVFADLRFGLRALRASPGFSAVVVLTLGLAIGVNSTIFSLARLALFPPLPIENPDTLVFVRGANPELNRVRAGISAADLADLKADSTTLADLAGFTGGSLTLTGADQPTRLGAAYATANLFDVFGLDPARGRRFRPGEDEPGAPHVVLLGHGAWQRHFGADPSIVGETIVLDGTAHTVIGVLPEALEIGGFAGIDVWTPLRRGPAPAGRSGVAPPAGALPVAAPAARDRRDLSVVGRLAPGASLQAARDELLALSRALQRQYPDTNAGWQAQVVSFTEGIVGPNVTALFALLSGAVMFILAIACANVANLMLARSAVRRQELAVRRAMGAGRGRLVRQLLTESGLLALLSAAAGVLLAGWTLQGLVALGRGGMPLFEEARIDASVLGFAVGLALLTPLIFGVVPALRSTGFDLARATRFGSGGAAAGRPRRLLPRSGPVLAALQVALAVVLLIVAGLTARSVIALVDLELGFDGDNVITLEVELPDAERRGERAATFFEQARASIEETPAIERAAWTSHLPLTGGQTTGSIAIEGRPAAGEADIAWVDTVVVTPGYFATLDIPVTRGRTLQASDRAAGRPVALVSAAAVRRYWPGADPIGARVRLGGLEADAPWLEIVGVVGDVRNPDADQPPAPQLYLPLAQHPTTSMALVARTGAGGQAAAAVDEVRRAIWSIAPDLPIDNVRTMGEVLYDDFAGSISFVGLATLFAFVALCLAAAGVYAVIAFRVSRRQRDIGIRMALGARRAAVLTMVMRQGLAPLLAGLLLGLAGGFAISRLIAGSLFGVGPSDPVTFLGVPALLLAIGVVASLVPALRATRIDPLEAVRAG